jgi:hypothetical protein
MLETRRPSQDIPMCLPAPGMYAEDRKTLVAHFAHCAAHLMPYNLNSTACTLPNSTAAPTVQYQECATQVDPDGTREATGVHTPPDESSSDLDSASSCDSEDAESDEPLQVDGDVIFGVSTKLH